MAKTLQRERLDCEDRLFEEAFILLVQTQIQGLLNEKELRYRDLSKRLGVSEARVSQMLGDEGVNLTIRTVARVFRQLGEVPLLMSKRAFERALGSRECRERSVEATWTMLAIDALPFEVACVAIVEADDRPTHRRPAQSNEWIAAEPLLVEQAG